MKTAFRLVTACLLVCLMSPRPVQSGGYSAENPYEIAEMLFAKKNYRTALTYYQKALKQGDVRAEYKIGLISNTAARTRPPWTGIGDSSISPSRKTPNEKTLPRGSRRSKRAWKKRPPGRLSC